MSLLLEIHSNSIPASYMALFPHLLQPVLWERTGNIPPLVRLLQAYLEKGGETIARSAADKIVSMAQPPPPPPSLKFREQILLNFIFTSCYFFFIFIYFWPEDD